MSPRLRAKSNNDELVAKQRERIAKAALSLYIKRGFRSTGVHQVAKAAHMSVGNLYHYIGSREDILLLVVELARAAVMSELQDMFRKTESLDPREALISFIRLAYQVIDRNHDFVMFFFLETRNLTPRVRKYASEAEYQAVTYIESVLRNGIEKGEFEIDGDVRTFGHDIFVMIEMWALRPWFYKKRMALEDRINSQTGIILRCINKPAVIKN